MTKDWNPKLHPRSLTSGQFVDAESWISDFFNVHDEEATKADYRRASAHQREALGSITRGQSDAAGQLISNPTRYTLFGELLRGQGTGKMTETRKTVARSIGVIDSLFEREGTRTAEDLVSWRGLSTHSHMDLTPGAEFTEPSYSATSASRRYATGMSELR